MIRKFAAPAVLLLTVACATTPMTSSSATTPAAPVVNSSSMAAAEYVLLSSPTSVRDWDATDPEIGFHVRGAMTTRGFVPAGGVQGRGKLCADGKDWISFSDMKVHKAADGGTPTAPYLLGCASGTTFVPASREIVTQ
jgi:hypothetical protein